MLLQDLPAFGMYEDPQKPIRHEPRLKVLSVRRCEESSILGLFLGPNGEGVFVTGDPEYGQTISPCVVRYS